ncbi:MAG: hypothetical protein IPO09_19500 [Anaeromyxobacter sp.]|nr:hypothetical protein [Anaeromyxobacter sp.]
MPAALGLLLGLALAADGLGFEAGVAAEARSRSLSLEGSPTLHTLELAAVPRAGVRLERADLVLTLAYAPRLVMADALADTQVDALHLLELAALAQPAPWLAVSGEARGAFGTTRLRADARRPDEPTGAVATPSAVPVRQAEAAAAATAHLDPLTEATARVAWYLGGGADAEARLLVPEERRLRLDAAVRWRLTRVDELGLAARIEDVRFPVGDVASYALLTAEWRRRLGLALEAWASAGAGASLVDGADRAATRRATWAGEVGLRHSAARGLTQRLALRTTPVVDRLTGAVDRRIEAALDGEWALAPAWRLGGHSVATLLQRDAGDARLLSLDLRIDRAAPRGTSLGAGAYATWQRTKDPSLPSFAEVGVFLAASWSTPRQ